MRKEGMTGGGRRCSHCGSSGHNSRTCNDRKGRVKLFGVKILAEDMDRESHHLYDENPVKRSLSMGNLASHHHLNNQHMLMQMSIFDNGNNDHHHHGDDGYLSDGLTQYSSSKPDAIRRRKKGVPWTEEEHKTFLAGLKKLGRGDWRGISKNFVHTTTPTQVASHAQKYFMRQLSAKDMKKKKKRRLSLFDLSPTSPCPSPLHQSPPRPHAENFKNGSSDSSEHFDLLQAFQGLPYMSCHRSDIPRLENYADNENLMNLNSPTSVTPRQIDDTRLQLGFPSFASSKAGLMSSMVDDMLELRIALPVGLHSK